MARKHLCKGEQEEVGGGGYRLLKIVPLNSQNKSLGGKTPTEGCFRYYNYFKAGVTLTEQIAKQKYDKGPQDVGNPATCSPNYSSPTR